MRRLLRTIRLFFFSADTPMLPFIAQRIVKAVVVLLAIVILNFFLIRAAPGDPAVVMAGEAGASDPLFIAQLREKFGLDQPLPKQLFIRSEEHTSELQSLMRISYAVFCLKKNNKYKQKKN